MNEPLHFKGLKGFATLVARKPLKWIFVSGAHKTARRQFFPLKQVQEESQTQTTSLASTARALLSSLAALEDPLAREPLNALAQFGAVQPRGRVPKERKWLLRLRRFFWGLTLAAQAHRYHFDRKHPADLNWGFGRQEESRRNGSHLVCLSESERRRRLWLRRELLRSYISPGLPPFPRPLPRPFSPPQAVQPAQLQAESKVRYSADPFLSSGSLPPPLPRRLAFRERDAGGQGSGRRRHSLRAGTRGRCTHPRGPPPARPLHPGPAFGQDPRSLGPHHRLLSNRGFWSISRPQTPWLRRSPGEPHLPEEAAETLGRRGRERRRFERARSGDWAAYSSGKNGCLGSRGIRGGRRRWRRPGVSDASSEGQQPPGELGFGGREHANRCVCLRRGAGGRRRARLQGPRRRLLPPPLFLKEKFYVGNIKYRTNQ